MLSVWDQIVPGVTAVAVEFGPVVVLAVGLILFTTVVERGIGVIRNAPMNMFGLAAYVAGAVFRFQTYRAIRASNKSQEAGGLQMANVNSPVGAGTDKKEEV